ncbi:forkhead box protein P1 isoform X4 [Strongylocentrotus purpuratus]|uniref:Fork-head domain-containing protein n=1 Tax=Strongylocentrotus purpuratus TaxID=7668 RepID=A0A7M7HR95_STRPU|nr:forkhead box protein P1 isoform X4 [Strongylocentrotus purpuratus]
MSETLANSAGASPDSKQRITSENDVRSNSDIPKKSETLSMLSGSEKSLHSGGGSVGGQSNHHLQLQHLLMPPGATQTLSAQQMQSLLQGQVLSQHQLQQLVLQQQSFLQQQQLQEQATLLQQMQAAAVAAASGDAGKAQAKLSPHQQQLHSLALQQAHMIQLQAQQQAVASGQMMLPPRLQQAMSVSELQSLWKEVSSPEDVKSAPTSSVASMLPGLSGHHRHMMNGLLDGSHIHPGFLLAHQGMMMPHEDRLANPNNHPLYAHGMCKWPGCETVCEDFPAFLKHLSTEHALDDRSTAQARVQMQVVNQLEIQLTKERERLAAMMAHLHMKPPIDSKQETPKSSVQSSPSLSKPVSVVQHTAPSLPMVPSSTPPVPITSIASAPYHVSLASGTPKIPPLIPVSTQAAVQSLMSQALRSPLHIKQQQQQFQLHPANNQSHKLTSHHVTPGGPIRRRNSEKYGLSLSTAEIHHNSDFYKNTDVRPPFTYAALIRQGIIDAPDRQLTLNEIYNWFTRTFAYFRRNAATWKNAVRHNLSLHKCFVRVENVKGAVWTVDEIEFMKRRPQRMGSLNTPPSTPNTPTTPISKSVDMLPTEDMPLNLETHMHPMGGSLPLLSDAAAAAADHAIQVLDNEEDDLDGDEYPGDPRGRYPGDERDTYPEEERERYLLEVEDRGEYPGGERGGGDPFPDDDRDSYPQCGSAPHPDTCRDVYPPGRERSPGDAVSEGELHYRVEQRERFASEESERFMAEERFRRAAEEDRYAREGEEEAAALEREERETYPRGLREEEEEEEDIGEVEERVRNAAIGDELVEEDDEMEDERDPREEANHAIADLIEHQSAANRRKVGQLTMEQLKRMMHHNPMMMIPVPTNGQSEHHPEPSLEGPSQGVM